MSAREEEVTEILDRVAVRGPDERDVQRLRQLGVRGDRNVLQVGGRKSNVGSGRDIHIGDRIYHGTEAEAVRELLAYLDPLPHMSPALKAVVVLGVLLCLAGLGIFFSGLIVEMMRSPQESLRRVGSRGPLQEVMAWRWRSSPSRWPSSSRRPSRS